MDDGLGHPVAGGGLSAKDGHARGVLLALFGGERLDGDVSVDDPENVHLLALVLVYALDLDIEECVGVDDDASRILDMSSKSNLVGKLDLCPFLLEFLVIHKFLKLIQQSEVLEEPNATSLGSDQLREAGVGLVQPSARGDSVGDIRESISSENLDKVLEDRGFDEIRMELGDSIDLVRTDNGQISHTDHLGSRFLNNGDASEQLALLWELALHSLEEEKVDIIDDLQVSRKEVLEQWNGPLLQRLRENSVVGVAECFGND